MSRYHETIIEEEEEEEEVVVAEARREEPRSLSGLIEEEEEEEDDDVEERREEGEAEEEFVLYEPKLEDFEQNGEGSSGLGVMRKVRFGHVTSYFFHRAQGIDQQPSDGQSPALGMDSEHFAEYQERVPLDPRFDMTTLLSDGRRVFKQENTFEALHCEDRRRLLSGAGISRLEWDDIRNVHHFRKVMGCTCRPTCKSSCHCMEGGVPCNANCTCTRPNCGHEFEDLQVLRVETRRKVVDRLRKLEAAGCSSNEGRRKRWLAPDLDGQPPAKRGRLEVVEEEGLRRKRKMTTADENEQPARKRSKLDEDLEEEGEAAGPPPRAIEEVAEEVVEVVEEVVEEEEEDGLEAMQRLEKNHKRCMEKMLGEHCGNEHIEALRLWSRAKPALTRGLNGVPMTDRQLSVLTRQIDTCMRLLGVF